MGHAHQVELERLGLSEVEAEIYLALLSRGGSWRAGALATTLRIPRSTVYLVLNTLLNRGLVENEAGYGGRFSAIPAERALPSLIAAQREQLLRRQREIAEQELVASKLARELISIATPLATNPDAEVIQVLRDPRVVAGRFEQLQKEAKQQIDVFVKAPIIITDHSNPVQEKAMRRGVRCRGLYESAVLATPEIKPFFAKWIAAGEEARVHHGELPHKLAIFDRQNILMPLITSNGSSRTLFIRHPQLAASLGLLFDFLWERSEPVSVEPGKSRKSLTKATAGKTSGMDNSRTRPETAIRRRAVQQRRGRSA